MSSIAQLIDFSEFDAVDQNHQNHTSSNVLDLLTQADVPHEDLPVSPQQHVQQVLSPIHEKPADVDSVDGTSPDNIVPENPEVAHDADVLVSVLNDNDHQAVLSVLSAETDHELHQAPPHDVDSSFKNPAAATIAGPILSERDDVWSVNAHASSSSSNDWPEPEHVLSSALHVHNAPDIKEDHHQAIDQNKDQVICEPLDESVLREMFSNLQEIAYGRYFLISRYHTRSLPFQLSISSTHSNPDDQLFCMQHATAIEQLVKKHSGKVSLVVTPHQSSWQLDLSVEKL